MEMQSLIVLALVAAAALYLGRKMWRTARAARQPADGCGSSCGCGEDPAAR
jgi:hypothetical protein